MRGAENEGRLGVKFSKWQPFWAKYDVIDTDYETYALVYSCTDAALYGDKSEYAWILTREDISLTDDDRGAHTINAKAKSIF